MTKLIKHIGCFVGFAVVLFTTAYVQAQTLAVTPGTLTTLIGNGGLGTPSGTNITALTAKINPYAVAVAPGVPGVSGGDVYISNSNNWIFVIYEGGQAAENIIQANYATDGLASSSTTPTIGNVYVIAGTGATLPSNGIAGISVYNSTCTGTVIDQLSGISEVIAPRGLAVDSYGNLFIAQNGSTTCSTAAATAATVQVIYAGNISAQGTNPAASLIHLENTTITTANLTGSSAYNGFIFSLAGGGSSYSNAGIAWKMGFNSPRGIFVDASEDLFIAAESTNQVYVLWSGVTTAGTAGAKVQSLLTTLGYTAVTAGDMYIILGGVSATTYAGDFGDTAKGYTGAGNQAAGTATTATSGAAAVAFNPLNGNIYVAEQVAQKIRLINGTSGVVSTLVGPASCTASCSSTNATAGAAGDGSLAGTGTEVNTPRGITVDAAGNLYIADTVNAAIRKIDANGYISTVAGTDGVATSFLGIGGNATNAELEAAYNLAVDAYGNIYVADETNGKVNEVNVSTAVAGTQGQSTTSGAQGYSLTSNGSFAFSTTQTVGTTSSPVTAIIYNVSGSSVTPSAVNIPNGFTQVTTGVTSIDGVSTACSTSSAIAAGSSCILELEFSPITAGAYTGSATVTAGSNTVSVPVTGTATTGSTSSTTSVAITSPSNPPYNYLSSMTFTATLTSGASGNVLFYDSGTLLATVASSGNTATYTTSSLAVGSHSITATYAGNATYATSNSSASPVAFTIVNGAAVTSTALSVSPSGTSDTYLTPLTFTATVTSGGSAVTSGTVTFYNNSTAISSAITVNGSGVATYSTSSFTSGSSNSVTAVYAGNISYQASTSNALSISITAPTPVTSTTTLTPSTTTPDLASSVTLSVSVTVGATNETYPTGTVTLTDTINGNTITLGTITLTNGTGSLVTKALPFGSNSIAAGYGGDLFYSSSTNTSSVTVSATRLSATPGVISALIGNGTAGSVTSPTGAATYYPTSVRVDTAGNVYYVDYKDVARVYNPNSSAETIAGVSVPAGTIATLAGTSGTACSSPTASCGDGAVSTSALLNVARGIAIDAYGNIYIDDAGENRLRVIINSAPTGSPILAILTALGLTPVTPGSIYTIAGNGTTTVGTNGSLATAQGLNNPRNLLIDSAGDIIIADYGSNRVRVLYAGGSIMASLIGTENSSATPSVGQLWTIAGTGTNTETGDGGLASVATLGGPAGVAFDINGNLLVADYGGNTIRRINISTGDISLVAGVEGGGGGFYGDGSAAGATTQFHAPRDVWTDWAGNIYISDFVNDRIREINTSNIVSTVAGYTSGSGDAVGNGLAATAAFLNEPQDVTFDNSGNLVIADYYNSYIRSVRATSSALTFPTTTQNGTSTLTAVLSNTGSTSITFTGISSLPTGFAQTASGGTDCTGTITLASGQSCNLQIAFTPPGTSSYSGTATITSNAAPITIALSGYGGIASTNTLSSSATAVKDNGTITLTASVTSSGTTPTGVVNFYYTAPNSTQQTWFAVASLSSGTATTAATALPAEPAVGNYTLTAQYAGDSNNDPSTSNAIVVADGGTTTVISGVPATTTASTSQTITVSVTGLDSSHNPSGTVTLTATPAGGSATTLLSAVSVASAASPGYVGTLPAGTDTITATFNGDSYNASSTGTASSTVGAQSQTITFTAPTTPVTYGASAVTLSATATSGLTVAFTIDSSSTSGACSVSGTTLTFTGVGNCVIDANQAGNGSYSAAPQVQQTVVINQASQTITGFNPPSTYTYGSGTITLSATGGASGNAVTFTITNGTCGTLSGTNNSTLTITGICTLTVAANQAGSTDYLAATQVTANIAVSQGTQTITGFNPPSSTTYGSSPITLSATGGASGNPVTFSITAGSSYGTLSGTNNSTLTLTGVGAITVAANQASNTDYLAATQVTANISVGKGTSSASVSSSVSSATPAQSVTLTATVTGPGATAPTGTVTFYSNGSSIGTGTLASGTATYTGTLAAGSDSITVVYNGDSNYNSSPTSSAISVNIGTYTSSTSLSSSLAGVVPGQPVTLTATVSGTGAGTPTGTVIFSAASTGATSGVLGTGTLVNGVATYFGLIWGGTDTVTATYNGDLNYGSSVSNSVTVSNYPNTGKLQFNWPFVSWGQAISYGSSTGTWPVTLQNLTGVTVAAPSLSFSGAYASNFQITGNGCTASLAQGATCSFNLVFSPVTGGTVHGTTTTATLTASASTYSSTLSVSGIAVSSSLTFNWPFLNFTPTVAVGVTSSDWPVVLSNQSGTPTTLASPVVTFTDASFAIDPATDTCSGVTLPAGGSCTYSVNFTPLAGDITHSGTNIISGTMTASGNSGTVTGTLNVGGWGGAALGFNWPFVTFQNQAVGSTGTNLWPVTVTNYSGATITGLSYTFTGVTNYVSGAFTLTNTCASLAPGASCTFDIAPSPQSGQANGAYSATLVVSGGGFSSYALSVSGTAIAGGYAINWNQDQQAGVSTIDFGPQNAAGVEAGPWPITVYNNTGSAETVSLTPSLPQFTTDVSTLSNIPSGGSATFNLYFTPTADTTYQGTLSIAGGGYTCVFNTWGGANK